MKIRPQDGIALPLGPFRAALAAALAASAVACHPPHDATPARAAVAPAGRAVSTGQRAPVSADTGARVRDTEPLACQAFEAPKGKGESANSGSAPSVPSALRCCPADRRARASEEMQRMRDDDQRNRQEPMDPVRTVLSDFDRRVRVGELFGAGCLETAQDFAAAALIYQHGDRPEHYMQAYLFASRAVALGDTKSAGLVAVAIDRYLVSTGHKQIFASQAFQQAHECLCLEQVEPSFPDEERARVAGRSLAARVEWLKTLRAQVNADRSDCANAPIECARPLLPTERGSLPGVW